MLPRCEPVSRLLVALLPLGLLGDGASLRADDPTPATISAESRALFEKQIQPLLVRTCGDCHGKEPTDNDLDLTSFGSAQAILVKPKLLGEVAHRLLLGDMPPKDAPQPTQAEREQLLGWIAAALDAEAAARAGDPGPVTLRRLSNSEYDNAIRDLTGIDMRPTQAREFPTDSVGGESQWASSKRLLAESRVAEGGTVPFERKVSVERGELLLLTVLPNENYGADSTLIEWTIRETTGEQRTWSVADVVPNLLKGNPWSDKHEARWSFLETTSTPVFLTERRDSNAGRGELKSWSLGSEPSVFVNSAAEPIKVWTTLAARSVFVHPGQKRTVAIAWTSPITGELSVAGGVADAHPSGGDGVSFELSHVAAPDLGQALADMGSASSVLPDAGLPPDMLAPVREKWREATTDPAPVLAAIKAMQDQLFQGNYKKNAALAVGNGFPAWEDLRRVVARERVQGAAREPLFRMVALPAQPDTFVIWDRLRLEGGDGPPLVFAEHPELGAAIEQAPGLKFGQHPRGRPVPKAALVTAAGAEIVIDLRKLVDMLVNDRPVADVISADAVVINDVLARHYGIPGVTGSEWRRVEKVSAYGRGGLLGFGAMLAKQSASSRTSPVKRGAWVVRLVGERLPKVPPGTPPLPETPPDGLSVREITERHRADQKCAGCHVRIDPYGMTLEQFDALGRLRSAKDLKPGDARATTRDGVEIDGFAGLRDYIAGPRREDLLRELARKLTGYSLGRAVLTSDRNLVDEVTKTMANGGRWSDTLLVIVRSEQFRCI